MLVHILEPGLLPDSTDWDYDNAKFLGLCEIESYDKFVRFIQTLKENSSDLKIKDEWYTVDNYAFSFPADKDSIPVLYVYVISY